MNNPIATPKKFGKILLAVDHSTRSAVAAAQVGALALQSGAEVQVLHVWDPVAAPEVVAPDGASVWDPETSPQAMKLVAEIGKQLADMGVRATVKLRSAPAQQVAEAISHAAVEFGADLVALGTRGRSDLGGLLFGSVSHKVLGNVACPVLVVRSSDAGPRRGIRRVLLAVAGGDEVTNAIGATAAVAWGASAKVLVLHVRYLAVAESGSWQESDTDAAVLVAGVVRQLHAAGVDAEGRVADPSSFVAHEIALAADEWDADVIVVGSRRLSEWAGLLENSVSHEVIHVAHRAVLIASQAARV